MTQITSFTDYFKEERDIYVQNISSYNVVVNFDMGGGQSMSHTFMPTRDPVNLTQYIPFKSIASSSEFRKMVNRRPAVLRLMSHDDYIAYYTRQAESKSLRNVDEAIEAAADRYAHRFDLADKTSPDEEPEQPTERKRDTKGAPLSEEEVINPRILNLCLQVHPSVNENEKMSAQDMLTELEVLSGQLKFDDWDYVCSHGWYKSVKNYAKQQRDNAAAGVDDTGAKTAKKKAKKKAEPKVQPDDGAN